jgi:hypothetical protein
MRRITSRTPLAATAEFAKTGKGLIGHGCADTWPPCITFWLTDPRKNGISVIEAGIKWRPEPSELAELGPEFKEVWDSYFANAPDKPVLWFGVASAYVL